MPPALRRTASSPAVRSVAAPYPPASPSSLRMRQGRRRGVSDANSRRVLADIEWWRVMQGQREEERVRENERDDTDDTQEHGLYTLTEDPATPTLAHDGVGHSRGGSDVSSDDSYPPSSTESTPPRAPSLPPLDTAALSLGTLGALFAPHRTHARTRASPPPTTDDAADADAGGIFPPAPTTHIFARAPHTIRLPHDSDVGIYTAGHAQRHRHRSASFPGVTAGAGGADEGSSPAV